MAEKTTKSVFETLNAIDCNGHTEKKNGLTYLSWAWAWTEVKKNYPTAFYTVYENAQGLLYHTDGKTAWVKTGVTIEGLEHIEYLPVMDFKNQSIPLERLTSFDVNKAVQRSLTKACARHGLGLYIYAGEDLPEEAAQAQTQAKAAAVYAEVAKAPTLQALTALWNAHPECQADNAFVEALKKRRAELTPQEKVQQAMAQTVK